MSNHTHHHNHTHNHVHTNNKKVLTISFIIIGLFMIVEILGGFIANSLALYQMDFICLAILFH